MLKVCIQNNPLYHACIRNTLQVFALNKSIVLQFVNDAHEADLRIDETPNSDLPVALNFYTGIQAGKYEHENYFHKECLVYTNDGKADLLATCFYMINSLQEYNSTTDTIGRFAYVNSYQRKFRNVKENLVQKYFDRLADHPKFSGAAKQDEKTRVFISHDIDNVNAAWKEDGFAALKKGQVHHIFRLLFNAALQKPDWFNMDLIMKIHDEHSLRSTFFWLANKGRSESGLYNADYTVSDKKVQDTIARVKQNGFENGIHKSVSNESFAAESQKLGFIPLANRYHYLKFNLPDAYDELQAAGIKLDTSLGFSEQYGFRNSYGQAFQPFNISAQKPYGFVELPLHVMDRTFHHMRTPVENIAKEVIAFFEQHKYNCTLSLLWHNNFFNSIKYKGYLEEYKKIISYLYENDIRSLSQQELIDRYFVL